MSGLSLVQNRALRRLFANYCLNKVVLAINGAGAATVRTTNAIGYTVEGLHQSKAALSAQSIAVTHGFQGEAVAVGAPAYVQPAQTTVIYVLAADAAGNIIVVQGSYAGQTIAFANDLSKILTGNGGMPIVPITHTPFGAIKVATAAATTFTPGTTLLDAAGITATYFDVAVLPETL